MVIYVSRIAPSVTENNLKKLFEQYGSVTKINFITDGKSGKSKSVAFVEMPANDEGQAAIEALNGIDLDGSILTVLQASPNE